MHAPFFEYETMLPSGQRSTVPMRSSKKPPNEKFTGPSNWLVTRSSSDQVRVDSTRYEATLANEVRS